MKINGISYWVKDGKCEMLNLDDGLKTLRIPAFMDKVNGEVIGLCGSVEKFIVEDGNPNYYVKNNCLMSFDGELVAGAADSIIPTDGSVKRIGNMAFLHKAPMHLVIPNGVKSIGYCAFAESKNLRSVYIPESVEEISYPFERCDELVSIFFDGSREQWEGVVKKQRLNLFGFEPNVYYKTEGINSRHLCPICGKMMFHTYNSHERCEGCNWMDEAWYETHPDEKGVRGYTLNEYKLRYNKWCEENPNCTFVTDWDDIFWWDEEDDDAFKKWKGFILQLAEVYLPITPQEATRLQAELSVIEKTNGAEVFQAIYDAWHLLTIKGIHSYITGEAEEWFIFHFLDMARENPIERELPTQIPSKITFVMEEKAEK